jgi:hypothetical protein
MVRPQRKSGQGDYQVKDFLRFFEFFFSPCHPFAKNRCLHYGILSTKKSEKLLKIIMDRKKRQRTAGPSVTSSSRTTSPAPTPKKKKKKIKVEAEGASSSSGDKGTADKITSATL